MIFGVAFLITRTCRDTICDAARSDGGGDPMKTLLAFSAWTALSLLAGLLLGCILRLCHKGEQREEAAQRRQAPMRAGRSSEQITRGENAGFDVLPDRSSCESDRNAKDFH